MDKLTLKDSQLPIPYGVELTQTSLALPDDLPFDDWQKLGATLKDIEKSVQWWIGDWLNYGERKYGETYAQVLDETDYVQGTLRNAKWVASSVEMSRRRDILSFSHHQEVAPLEPDEQDQWMGRAELGAWSVRKLRAEIQQHRSRGEGKEPKIKATISIEVQGGQAAVSLRCDDHILAAILTPTLDSIRTIVWESLNPAEELAVSVNR